MFKWRLHAVAVTKTGRKIHLGYPRLAALCLVVKGRKVRDCLFIR